MWVLITKRKMPSGNTYEIRRKEYNQWDRLTYDLNRAQWKQENIIDIIRIERNINVQPSTDAPHKKYARKQHKH